MTTFRCLCCACRGCAISADNLCLPLQDDTASRPQGRRQTAGCLDSYLIPQITAARPEAGNARRSVAVVHRPRPTFAPQTQLSRTSALARVGYGGMYPGRGQMSSTSSDDVGPTATPHLICRRVTSRSLYVRMTSLHPMYRTYWKIKHNIQ